MKLEFGATYFKGATPIVYKGDLAGVKQFQTPNGVLGTVDPEEAGISYEPKAAKVEPKTAK